MHCTGIPHLIVLCRYSDFFTNWKFMASLLVPFFQQHLLPYVSVSHFDNSCNNFKHFHYYCYICYGDLWWVIFDVTIVIVLECHEPHPQKMVNLTDKCCVCSDYSIHWPVPISLLLFGPPCSLRHNNSEIRSVNNLAMTSKYSHERKGYTPLTLSQKLEMIKLSEEGMLKPETGQKLVFLYLTDQL